MHVHRIGCFTAAKVQHGRPEQGVEVGDVFANEVVLLRLWVCHEGIEITPRFIEVVF